MQKASQNRGPLKPVDLTNLLQSYINKWVALTSDQTRVAGSGITPTEALANAQSKGARDPILLFVPAVSGAYVLRE